MSLHQLTRRINTQSTLVKTLFQVCNRLYIAGSHTHSSLYKTGWLSRKSLQLPVISVGNLTAGGTGKTPIVQHLAQLILDNGGTPLVLSRGYGDDEQHQLKARLRPKGVALAFGSDRHRAATIKLSELKKAVAATTATTATATATTTATAIVTNTSPTPPTSPPLSFPTTVLLDDGLQHWALARDLEVVVINAYHPWGGSDVIPGGFLRETPQSGLARADLVIVHNASGVSTSKVQEIRQQIQTMISNNVPIVETEVIPSSLSQYTPHNTHNNTDNDTRTTHPIQHQRIEQESDGLSGANVMSISGIGCPSGFVDVLYNHLRVNSVDSIEYPDHHVYTQKDVHYLQQRQHQKAKEDKTITVITEKDYYRCLYGSASSSQLLETLSPIIVATDIQVVKEQDTRVLKDMLQVAADKYDQRRQQQQQQQPTSPPPSSFSVSSLMHHSTFRRPMNLIRAFSTTSSPASPASPAVTTEEVHHGFHHIPVLPEETQMHWSPPSRHVLPGAPPCLMVDVTAGGGAHSEAMLESTPDNVYLVCIDRDLNALNACKQRLNVKFSHRVIYVHASFSELAAILTPTTGQLGSTAGTTTAVTAAGTPDLIHLLELTNGKIAGVLADLGCSSAQLDTAERGFSFQKDGPLDMRMNQTKADVAAAEVEKEKEQTTLPVNTFSPTAADLINNMSETALIGIFQDYGDVSLKDSRRVARLICHARPMYRTTELVNVILGEKNKAKHFKKSPATKFFQSLRIAVNNELHELDVLLDTVPDLLCENGSFVVISFHSLEDRRVKVQFKSRSGGVSKKKKRKKTGDDEKRFTLITKKPNVATEEEIKRNPRARSSRLRVLQREGGGGIQ